jgi:hypothetical protein
VAGTCECGNEITGFIKLGEFLDLLRTCYLFKKDSTPWSRNVLLLCTLLVSFKIRPSHCPTTSDSSHPATRRHILDEWSAKQLRGLQMEGQLDLPLYRKKAGV